MKSILTYPKVWLMVTLLSAVVTTSYGQEQPAKRKSVRLSANVGFFNEWANPLALNSSISTPNHGQFIGASLDYFFAGRWFSRFGLHLERVVEDDLGRKKEGSFVTHKFSVTNKGTRKSFAYLSSFLAFGRSFNIKKVEVSPYIGVSTIPRPKLTSYYRTPLNERIETGVTEASLDFPGHLFASGTFDPYIGTDISLPIGENKRLGLRFQFVPADQPRVDFGLSFSHNFPSKFDDFLAKHKTPPSQLLSSPQFFFSMGTGYMKEYKHDEEAEGLTPNSALIYSFTGGVMNRKRWFFQFSYDLEDTREKDLNKNFLLRAMHFSVGKEFQWNRQKVRFFTGTSSIKDIGIWWRKDSASSKRVLKESPQKIANLFYLLGLDVSTPLYRDLHIGLRTKWITDFSNFGRTDLSAFLAYRL